MKNPEITVLAVLAAVLFAGWAVIQADVFGGTEAEFSQEGDGIEASISGFLPSEYSYSIYTGASVSTALYYWYDESMPCDSPHSSQSGFFDAVDALLKVRSHDPGIRVDTATLEAVMRESMADGTVKATAVYFCGGVLPKSLCENGLLKQWIEAGGTVHWTGDAMGYRVTSPSGVEVWDKEWLFPEGTVGSGSESDAHNHTYWSQRLVPTLTGCSYGLNPEALTDAGIKTVALGLVNDDGYASYAVSQFGQGRVYVIGTYTTGIFHSYYQMASADIIASGIDFDTEESCSGSGSKGYGSCGFTIDQSPSAGDVLYLRLGSPFVNWATTHAF